MGTFIVRRILGLVPTLAVIITLSFFVIRLAPGGPFQNERALPPEARAELEAKYGFDQPLSRQFVRYVGNLLRGDLGSSTKYQRSVNEIIALGFSSNTFPGGGRAGLGAFVGSDRRDYWCRASKHGLGL